VTHLIAAQRNRAAIQTRAPRRAIAICAAPPQTSACPMLSINLARAPHVGIDLDGGGRIDTRLTPNQSPTDRKRIAMDPNSKRPRFGGVSS